MINLGMDLFTLAEIQLQKENVDYSLLDVIDRAILIRKELDRLDKTGQKKIYIPIDYINYIQRKKNEE